MIEVLRYGFVIDRVYDRDQFGLVGPRTEGTIYVEAKDYDALHARATALQAENAALRAQLHDATTSLETISNQSGRDENMKCMSQVRGYANSRAVVARNFLIQSAGAASHE